MTPQKIYTVKTHSHYSSSRNHRLVRAAGARGLTNIKIAWYPKYDGTILSTLRGWYLMCDEFEKSLHLGYQVNEAEIRINKIEPLKIPVYASTKGHI